MHTEASQPVVTEPARPRAVTIVLIDDHPIVRHGMRELLEHEPDFCVCGEADGIDEGCRVLKQMRPKVAIIDLNLPDGDGLDLIRKVRACGELNMKLIVLSSNPPAIYGPLAKQAGADGYVPKHEAVDHIVDVVRCVLGGKRCFRGTCECESSHWFG